MSNDKIYTLEELKKKLTDKQKRFCKEYVIDFNATQAAIRSGYSKKTSQEIGAQNLSKLIIQEEIKKLQSKVSDKLEITHEMLTKEWAKMAFSSISHLHNTWIEKKEFEEIKENNPDVLDCIQEISSKVEKRQIGEQEFGKVEFVKLKLYDKQKALENLGKHIGYYAEDNEQKKPTISIDLESESTENLIKRAKAVKSIKDSEQ